MSENFRKRAETAAVGACRAAQNKGLSALMPDFTNGFVEGSAWALQNLPRCGSCRYRIGFDGTWYNCEYLDCWVDIGGCLKHSDLEGEK